MTDLITSAPMSEKRAREVIHEAIKKHAGLSDWDDEWVSYETDSIIKALKKNGYTFRKEKND